MRSLWLLLLLSADAPRADRVQLNVWLDLDGLTRHQRVEGRPTVVRRAGNRVWLRLADSTEITLTLPPPP